MRIAAVVLASIVTLPVAAEPVTYTVDPTHTFPSFEVSHIGFSTQRGRFNASSGKIMLDRAAKLGSIDIAIDTSSIDTGLAKLEEHLRSEDFFNVAKFPTITFKSDRVRFNGKRPVSARGDFTMLGVTKPVSLAITNFKCGQHPVNKKFLCGADASTSFRRSDYGMSYALPAVGDVVKINIQIEASDDIQSAGADKAGGPVSSP
ncbi:MAG: YceI family protein [Burkholderiales bacterium]